MYHFVSKVSGTLILSMSLGCGITSTAAEIVLFEITDSWKFQQTTNFDGVKWQAPGFNDSDWPSGPGLLYVEDNTAVAPRLTPLVIGRMTYYFRAHFDYSGPRQGVTLTFSNRIDDGAVLYLNGVEIQRVRLPSPPTPIMYASVAGTPASGDATSFDVFSISGPLLTNLFSGDNVVAAEVHQSGPYSTDIVFGSALSAVVTNPEVAFLRQPADLTVLDGRPASVSVVTSGAEPISYQWFKDGVAVPGADRATNAMAAVTLADAGTYQVVASNLLNVVTSAPARLTVLQDATPPQLVSAISARSSNTVTVTFSEAVDPVSATNLAHYEVYAAGNPLERLPLLSAALEGEGIVRLTTTPRAPGIAYRLRVTNVTDIATARNPVPPDSVLPILLVMDLVVIDDATGWRYEPSGSDLGQAWREPAYDDSGWSNGLALFDGRRGTLPALPAPRRTVLNLTNATGTAQVITYYFRRSFSFEGPLLSPALRLWNVVDDGAVLYLNGTEVFRARMPTSGPITAGTLASSSVGNPVAEPPLTGPGLEIPATSLVVGENVLAVEVHQDSPTSPDITFGAALEVAVNGTPEILLSLPASVEENAGTLTNGGTIALTAPADSDLVVHLTSSDPASLSVPATVVVSAGHTNAAFDVTLVPDGVLDGPQIVRVTAQASRYRNGQTSILVVDSDTTTLAVTLPAALPETAGVVTGAVTSAQAPVTGFLIRLESSDANSLRIPATAFLAAGQTTAVFTATVPDDPWINGTRVVSVTASVTNWTPGVATVEVLDNEGTNLLLTLPSTVTEGDGVRTNAGQVRLQGVLSTNLGVSLVSSGPIDLAVPTEVTILAGQSNASFNVTVPENSVVDGTRTITVSAAAPGFLGGGAVVTVLDNDPHHFRFSPIGQLQTTSTTFVVTMTACDASDAVLTTFTRPVTLQAVGLEGVLPTEPTTLPAFRLGQSSANVRVTVPGTAVRLRVLEGPGESDGFNVGLPLFSAHPQRIVDAGWHASSGALFATVPYNGGAYANQLIAMDPQTGAITNAYALGPDPGLLEISPDDQFLYVTLSNRQALQRFDLSSRQAGLPFAIETNRTPAKTVQDFCILTGVPDSLVVVGMDGYTRDGVWRFDGGRRVVLPNFTASGGWFLENSPVAGEVLLSPPLVKGQAQPYAGLATAADFSGNSATYRDGRIYDDYGGVLSGATLARVGTYPEVVTDRHDNTLVEVDPSLRRVFFLEGYFNYGVCWYKLRTYDRDLFKLLASYDAPRAQGSPIRLIRCGTNGLAYVANNGQLWFVRPDLLAPLRTPADLSLRLSAASPLAVVGSNYTFTLSLSNAGPGIASIVRVTNSLPLNVAVVQSVASTGSVALTSSGFTWNVSALAAGSEATLAFTVLFGNAGWQTNAACALSFEQDPVFTNNTNQWAAYVQLPPATPGVFPLNFPCEDLAYDPALDRLLVSVGQGFGAQTNGIAVLNPHTGVMDRFVGLGLKPAKLARSADGRFLYVSLPTNGLVRRLDLPSLATLQEFALGGEWIYSVWYPFYAADMAVVPGQPLSLVAWRVRRAGPMALEYGQGVGLYDSGVLRSNVTASGGTWRVEFDTDGGTLFACDSGYRFYRCGLDADGITLAEAYPLLDSTVGKDAEYAADRLFTTAGRAVRLAPFGVEGIYPGSENAFLVEPDPARGRVFYLAGTNILWRLNAYTMDSFDFLGSLVVSNVAGAPNSLIRCGTDGFAFRTTGNQLFLIRTDLGAPATLADVALSQTGPAGAVDPGANMIFTLTVTNLGPDAARDLALTNQFSAGATVISATSSAGNSGVSSNAVAWNAATLGPAASVTITVTVRSATAGQVTSTAAVSASTPDPTAGNNTILTLAQIGALPSHNSVVQCQLPTRDLVWWPEAGKILATVSSDLANWSNGIVSIAPESGRVSFETFAGAGANEMAFSGDGHRLFVGVDFAVQTFDLPSLSRSLRFPVDPSGGAVVASDLEAPPASSNLVAVSRSAPWPGSVAIYEDGFPRPNMLSPGGSRLEFSAPDRLHALTPGVYYAGYLQLANAGVDSDGLTLLTNHPGFSPWGTGADLKFDQGRLYTSPGFVFDPDTLEIVGTFPSIPQGSLVQPETAAGRVFFLLPESNAWVLVSFDPQSYQRLGSMGVAGVLGTPTGLVRWGNDGFAFRTSSGQVFLLRTDLLPTTAPTDLAVNLSAGVGVHTVGSNSAITLTLTNGGPNDAPMVSWTNSLPAGATVVSAIASAGTVQTNGPVVTGMIDSLQAGASAFVQIVFRPAAAGFAVATAKVTSDALDVTNANNTASALLWVHPAAGTPASDLFTLATKDLVRDGTGTRLYASLGANAGILANSVVVIEPATGVVGSPLFVGADPGRLAASADGQFLYVALDGERAVKRVRLADMTLDLRFTVPPNGQVLDMAVDPSNPELVAVRRGYEGNISLHEHGVARPNEVAGMDLFAFSDTTGELYACVGGYSGVPLYHVDKGPFGATLLESQPGKQSQAREMKFARGRLHFSRGMIVQPDARRVLAVLPVSYNALIEPDPAATRVFSLESAGGSTWVLHAFDSDQFVEVGAISIPGVAGTPTQLTRWGANGIAFRTDTQVFIGRTSLAPTNPPTDLALNLTVSPPSAFLGSPLACGLTLTNAGPSPAVGVVVTQSFSLPITNVVLDTVAGTAVWTNDLLVWQPGNLAHAASVTMSMTLRPLAAGTLTLRGVARHEANDPCPLNNAVLAPVQVMPPAGTNVMQFHLATRELVYDRSSGLILASVPALEGSLGNSVLGFDPASGRIERRYFAGSEPNQLAVSGDGRTLYVSEDGAMGVRRLDLLGPSPVLEFAWTLEAMRSATDLQVQPGQADTFAVALEEVDYWGHAQVVVYDGNTRRPAVAPDWDSPSQFVFSPDGARIYGPVAWGKGYGFLRLEVGPDGVTGMDRTTSFYGDSYYVQENGLLYGDSGQVVDPVVPTPVGTNAAPGSVAPDADARRVFYLTPGSSNWELRSFELGTYRQAGVQSVPGVQGTPGNLIRCGADRLAFRTSSNQFFIVRSALVPEAPSAPADLLVTQSAAQDTASLPADQLVFSVTVSNRGPGEATVVSMSDLLPQPAASYTVQVSQGSWTSSDQVLLWQAGALSAGASAQLRLVLTITNTITFTNLVNVTSDTRDPDLLNNTSLATYPGIWFQARDTVRRVSLATRDLAFDRVSRRLFASLADTDAGNEVVWLNPETGALEGSLSVGPAPDRLVVSDDGRYLYVSFVSTSLIQRVLLPSNTVDLAFHLPGTAPRTLAALPGQPRTLIAACNVEDNYVTAIFDDGVPRPQQVWGYPFTVLTVTPNGDMLYGYAWTCGGACSWLYGMRINGTGLTVASIGPWEVPWGCAVDMAYDEGRLYIGSGMILDAATWAEEPPFPGSGGCAAVEINRAADRAIFVTHDGYRTASVFIHDQFTRRQLTWLNIDGVSDGVSSLTQCDGDRLAFRSPTEVFLVRDSQLSSDPPADLALRGSVNSAAATLGNPVEYVLMATNAGPNPASNVLARLPLSDSFHLGPVTASRGTNRINGTYLDCSLGTLDPGGQAVVSITVTGVVVGVLSNLASVFSDAVDPNSTNNVAVLLNTVILPQCSIGDVEIVEGNVGFANARFSVWLNATSVLQTATVSFTTRDGTAIAAQDYVPVSGALTFRPGTNRLEVVVPVRGDTLVEPDETFFVVLSNASSATLGTALGTGRIRNDDGRPGEISSFVWGAIPAAQYVGLPVAASLTARDAQGNVVMGFNGAATLTPCVPAAFLTNGDFELGSLAFWTPLNAGDDPGPYQVVAFDTAGRGQVSYAFRLTPNKGDMDGIRQSIPLHGGVRYRVDLDSAQSLEDASCNGGETGVLLRVGGTDVCGFSFGTLGTICGPAVFRTNLQGVYLAPSNGLYDVQILIHRNSGPYPALWGLVDNLRITPVSLPQPIPQTVNFTHGAWTGNLLFTNPASDIFLRADDGNGHVGDSARIDIQSPPDTDADGLPDPWEMRYFGSLTGAGPSDDFDGDGMTNWEECRAGTNPTDPDDWLKIRTWRKQGTITELELWGAPGRTYRLERGETITGPWAPVGSPAMGSDGLLVLSDTVAPGRTAVFYRVRLEP